MKCPNCSGTLYFDIKNQNLKCRHCSATFSVDEYHKSNAAEENFFEGARLYTCRNCGAQLMSNDDEAVTYCNYCGSQQLLESEMTGVNEPKRIIPFKITKSECKRIYKKELKGKFYVPKEFKDPDFIDRFRPFYIPYWMYHVKFRDDEFSLPGSKFYTRGGYDYIEDYEVTTSIKDKGLYGVPFDASRNFDDSIAEEIAPFKKEGLEDYKEGYLAGMYADVPNVDGGIYEDEVLDKATELAVRDIKTGLGGIELKFPRGIKKQREFLDARYESEEAVYLPVWFLTWRKGDRVAYAVVNGQSGKIHIDLPADIGQFLSYTLLGAAALFVLLSLFVTVTSRFVLWFAALLAYLVARRYRKELKLVRDRENHVFDKGYLLEEGDRLPMSEKQRARLRRKGNRSIGWEIVKIVLLSMLSFIGMGILGALYDELVSQTGAMVMTFIIAVLEVINFLRTMSIAVYLKNKRSLLFALVTLAAIDYAFIVGATTPVQDWWYYLGALAALVAASLMCVDLLIRFNETATRPLPSFYNRKGGNDDEKDY
ncbi:MAG: hypothetical protein IJJ00_08075 [Erysipelotrichaceae bacterium]|nr:hypothetical protein [Erysipelotrichaceae bacterium]